jgi:hypothetical protein
LKASSDAFDYAQATEQDTTCQATEPKLLESKDKIINNANNGG